jgi:hypothetical protein
MYIPRAIETRLRKALAQFPSCVITGPRQSGKSTLLKHCLKEYTYVTFDNPLMRKLALEDPELFLSTHPEPLILDEIQYAPELLSYLKLKIDETRDVPGRFVLTGSQTFNLMKGVTESLAGRVALFHLYPLSWVELNKTPSPSEMALQTIRGFYPELSAHPHYDWNEWYGSYLSTYVERDVRNIKAITDLSRFQTFIGLLAPRAGQLLNLSEVAKECGISQPTAKDWISLLEATYVVKIMRPFHINRTKILVKTPKIFFVDTGLLCYLLGIDSETRFFRAGEKGHIFENMVIMEKLKRLSFESEFSQSYFYRAQSGEEIDLIVERGNRLEAYEIKLTQTLSTDLAVPLRDFAKEYPLDRASLLTLQEKKTALFPNIWAEPWHSV